MSSPRIRKISEPITKDNLPSGSWQTYQKTGTTQMLRMAGPFQVSTQEGLVFCPDGYLAIDADGYPYPVAAGVHEKTYILAEAPQPSVESIRQRIADKIDRAKEQIKKIIDQIDDDIALALDDGRSVDLERLNETKEIIKTILEEEE